MYLNILGIRHHGIGSAKNIKQALNEITPELILIEGPEQANNLINFVKQEEMKPPVALMLYEKENNKNCAYYPFAIFSPEWQALNYGLEKAIPIRFIDTLIEEKFSEEKIPKNNKDETNIDKEYNLESSPFEWISKKLGYQDSEKLWEEIIETKNPDTNTFEAIKDFFKEIRLEYQNFEPNLLLREAYMRKNIDNAKKEGFKNIAVICGAFHAPALEKAFSEEDETLLAKLKVKDYEAIWIPWSYNRLSFYTGYGAGIDAPAWYHHLWENEFDATINFVSKIAFLLRNEKFDVSSAGVIEAVKLAEILATLRGKNKPSLTDILDAVLSAICNANAQLLKLVSKELIVGNVFGKVPPNVPVTLIQKDFFQQLENCNIIVDFEKKGISLDLTNDYGTRCSKLFYRINILEIPFAQPKFHINLTQKYKEEWLLEWKEGFEIFIIEKGVWGNSIEEASKAYTLNKIEHTKDILELCLILSKVIGADLKEILDSLIKKIQEESINSNETEKLMAILSPLVQTYRYSNIQKTDQVILEKIISTVLNKIFINLLNLAINIDDDSFDSFSARLTNMDYFITIFNQENQLKQWNILLQQILENENTHPLISGYACKLLFEKTILSLEKTTSYLNFYVLTNDDYFKASLWIQGFLKNSIQVFINNTELLTLVNTWVCGINEISFINALPILKKAFSAFSTIEKNKIAKMININNKQTELKKEFLIDKEQAEKVLPVLKNIFKKSKP